MSQTKITVGKGSCGIAAGASEIFNLLEKGADYPVKLTGCIGMCYLEPIVNLEKDGENITFVKVDENAAGEIIKYINGEENNAGQYIINQKDLDNLESQ